jgi:hypothetical protein
MNDKNDLLQLAAKAAGIKFYQGDYISGFNTAFGFWNPITNDAQAFRLAQTLKMDINFLRMYVRREMGGSFIHHDVYMYAEEGQTMNELIVQAAAEIGRKMA